MDAQAAAVLEAALAQEGIRVADLSNEELAAIVATMYSALGQQPPTLSAPLPSDDDDADYDDDNAEDAGNISTAGNRSEHADFGQASSFPPDGDSASGNLDSAPAGRSALDESPRGSRQPWMDSSELLGDSMPLMPPSGRSPAAADGNAVSASAEHMQPRGTREISGNIRESAFQHAQLQYPPVDELFAGAGGSSDSGGKLSPAASSPDATAPAASKARVAVMQQAMRRPGSSQGLYGHGSTHDSADDERDDEALEPAASLTLRQSAHLGRASTSASAVAAPAGFAASAWPPAPYGATTAAAVEGGIDAGRAYAHVPSATALTAPAPPKPSAPAQAPADAAAAPSRGATAPASRRNSMGPSIAPSRAQDGDAASADVRFPSVIANAYDNSGPDAAHLGTTSVAGRRRPSSGHVNAQVEDHVDRRTSTASSLPPPRASAAHAPAAANTAATQPGTEGPSDGYVSVLFSTLQANAAAVAEAEAELRLVVRER